LFVKETLVDMLNRYHMLCLGDSQLAYLFCLLIFHTIVVLNAWWEEKTVANLGVQNPLGLLQGRLLLKTWGETPLSQK